MGRFSGDHRGYCTRFGPYIRRPETHTSPRVEFYAAERQQNSGPRLPHHSFFGSHDGENVLPSYCSTTGLLGNGRKLMTIFTSSVPDLSSSDPFLRVLREPLPAETERVWEIAAAFGTPASAACTGNSGIECSYRETGMARMNINSFRVCQGNALREIRQLWVAWQREISKFLISLTGRETESHPLRHSLSLRFS